MNKLNASIAAIPIPRRMTHLPTSETGYPVPWFVEWINDVPDFRVMDARKWARAVKHDLCWLCGATLGRFKTFAVGGMCAVNRISAEPPSHRSCAEYACAACPFLSKPKMRRNAADMPDGHKNPGGVMLERNPGVTLLWITHSYRVINDGRGGRLINIGNPVEVVAYSQGRLATRAELDESIRTGLPLLEAECDDEDDRASLAAHVVRANEVFAAKLKVAA